MSGGAGNNDHILVFKTNVETYEQKMQLLDYLCALNTVEEASIDLEDIDRVLRVVSYKLKAIQIIETVRERGLNCQELE